MACRLAIDAVVITHFLFILFVIFGALIAWKRPILKWLHWGALFYGLLIETFNWYCPLTLLEIHLRRKADLSWYDDSFISHHLKQLIYMDVPQWSLVMAATLVVAGNVVLYWKLARRHNSSCEPSSSS